MAVFAQNDEDDGENFTNVGMLDDKDDVDFATLETHEYGEGVNPYIGGIYPVTVICLNGVYYKRFDITIGTYIRLIDCLSSVKRV